MPGRLYEPMEEFLAAGHLGVLSAAGPKGVVSVPVRYRAQGLELDCAVPRWSDLAYLVEKDPDVTLVLIADRPDGLSWLHYLGLARPIDPVTWEGFGPSLPKGARPSDLFLFLHLRPTRIELMRGPFGRCTRETLDL